MAGDAGGRTSDDGGICDDDDVDGSCDVVLCESSESNDGVPVRGEACGASNATETFEDDARGTLKLSKKASCDAHV